jgi:hypothetical protein
MDGPIVAVLTFYFDLDLVRWKNECLDITRNKSWSASSICIKITSFIGKTAIN